MELRDLVAALRRWDSLAARAWVQEAVRTRLDWSAIAQPADLDPDGLAIAAGIAELLAARAGQTPPAWTSAVPPATHSVYLVRAASQMPCLRAACESEGPEPLRRRQIFAPPEFLTFA